MHTGAQACEHNLTTPRTLDRFPPRSEFGVSLALVGTLFSGTALAMVLSNVWLPLFADKYGRRNAMLISMVGSTIGYFGQATSNSFSMLLAFRVVQGLFGGVPPVAMAYVTGEYGCGRAVERS
jgi:MFS transporter, YNFM family, putative membrane transport protein